MRKPLLTGLLLAIALFNISATKGDFKYSPKNTYHSDFRDTPKLLFKVSHDAAGEKGQSMVWDYLVENARNFQISPSAGDLQLKEVKQSLQGKHFHYSQVLNDYDVFGGEIVVSIFEDKIYQVFNNSYPVEDHHRQKPKGKRYISEKEAFDIAWKDLKVHGPIMQKPKARRVYINQKGEFRLIYIVELAVEKPFGYWQHRIDAIKGTILRRHDTRIVRRPIQNIDIDSYRGPIHDRKMAFKLWDEVENAKKPSKDRVIRVDGKGLVFDPDPATALKNNQLRDESPASDFIGSYVEKILADISFNGQFYTLKGPWVEIADFESPKVAPSKTRNGHWTAKRGENSFNDAMTYFHFDQNQRYIQSLGFHGDRGIQYNSIKVDANGVDGSDNSHFVPGSNRIAFGHGCVDDNEDTDVILHEYGHAIHHSINRNWYGGDTGAMGEGFGDYWAGSYSYSKPAGKEYDPNMVFQWDGPHCWGGRRMDRMAAQYDHSRTYGAHVVIDGDIQSDELWSTPLFQAFVELREKGYTREDIDRLILEAHFGLGSGLKMRDMANAIISTARRLYPNEEFAQVFVKRFGHHGIIELPRAKFRLGELFIEGSGHNGAIDPGEEIALNFDLENYGNHDARGIVLKITDSTGMISQEISLSGVAAGRSTRLPDAIRFRVPRSFPCGKKIYLQLAMTFSGGSSSSQRFSHELGTGIAEGLMASRNHSPPLQIPDNDPSGTSSSIHSSAEGRVGDDLKVAVNLKHTFRGDLKMTLVSPRGKKVVLHNNGGRSADDIVGVYPTSLRPSESLSRMRGEPLGGRWKLEINDTAMSDLGRLHSWALESIHGYTCEN